MVHFFSQNVKMYNIDTKYYLLENYVVGYFNHSKNEINYQGINIGNYTWHFVFLRRKRELRVRQSEAVGGHT